MPLSLIGLVSQLKDNTISWTKQAIKYSTIALISGIGLYSFIKQNDIVNSCVSNIKDRLGM